MRHISIMRENRHEQGIVMPLPCLHMKTEIMSVYSSYCQSGGASVSTKCTLEFPGLKAIYHLESGRGQGTFVN